MDPKFQGFANSTTDGRGDPLQGTHTLTAAASSLFPTLSAVSPGFITSLHLALTSNDGVNATGSLYIEPMTREEFTAFMTQYSLYYVYIGIVVFIASVIQVRCWGCFASLFGELKK